MVDTLIELTKLGFVGLIAGLFSSVLSNRDYRQRKWFEMRVKAYQNAIEALSDIVYYYNEHYDAEITRCDLSEERSKQLRAFWEQSFPKVRKYADSGAFLFSAEANAALKELMTDDNEESYFEHLDNNLFKVTKCLTLISRMFKSLFKTKTQFI